MARLTIGQIPMQAPDGHGDQRGTEPEQDTASHQPGHREIAPRQGQFDKTDAGIDEAQQPDQQADEGHGIKIHALHAAHRCSPPNMTHQAQIKPVTLYHRLYLRAAAWSAAAIPPSASSTPHFQRVRIVSRWNNPTPRYTRPTSRIATTSVAMAKVVAFRKIRPPNTAKKKPINGMTTSAPSCSAARGSFTRLLTMIPTMTAMIVRSGTNSNITINHIGLAKSANTRSLTAKMRAQTRKIAKHTQVKPTAGAA